MSAWMVAACLLAAGNATPSDISSTPVRRAKREPTRLKFEVQPGSVVIYVDGKKKGKASKRSFVKVRPGQHSVRLVNGKDETEFDLVVNKGKTLVVKYAFEDSGRAPDPAPSDPPGDGTQRDKPDDKKAPPLPGDDLDSDIPR